MSATATSPESTGPFQEADVIRDACDKGTDLRVYAEEVHTNLLAAEAQLVLDFLELVPVVGELSQQVERCDTVLVTMETLLGGFQSHLSELNQAIQTIQGQSHTLQERLTNRLNVHQKVSQMIDGLVIPPRTIKNLMAGQVSKEYMINLQRVDDNFRFMQSLSQSGRRQLIPIKAIKEIAPEHDKLRYQTASTIRQFFLDQLEELGRMKDTLLINLNAFQKERLLPYQALNHIVLSRHPGVAAEIAQHYVTRAASYHLQYFDFYLKGLLSFQIQASDRYDLIGNDDTPKKGFMDLSIFGSPKTTLKDKYNLFSLGNRMRVLDFSEEWSGPIRIPEAERTGARIRFEETFKSFNVTLAASMALEYQFLSQFFSRDPSSAESTKLLPPELSVTSLFRTIFEPIFKRAHATYQDYVGNSYDAIGLLLGVRLNNQFASELAQLSIPLVDTEYYHANDRIFWPRFQAIINLHITSLKKTPMVAQTNPKDSNPHFLTRRYAEIAVSVLTLSYGHDEPMLVNGLTRLRTEYLNALDRMAGRIRHSKTKLVFLLNNYDLIQGVLGEYPRATESELAHFKLIHSATLAEYIKEELTPLFGDILLLVEQADEQPDHPIDPAQFARLATDFNQTYRASLAHLHTAVTGAFPNLHHATNILHSLLAHVMLMYTKFLTLLDTHLPHPSVAPVSVHLLKMEIKRYRTHF